MAPLWEPGTQYNYGDVVVFEDVMYKIIQPHRSQGDWTPPVTPALWGRLQRGGHHHHHREEQWGADCKPLPGGQQYSQREEIVEKVTYQGSYQAPAASSPQEHKEKHWYEEHKKELEIGAGVAGIAAVGAGIHAYRQHERKGEERQEVENVTYQSYQESYQAPTAPPQEKHWYEDHKKGLIGAGAIAAAGAGLYAYKQHEKVEEELYQESYQAPTAPPQEKHWYEDHKKELIGAGAIAAAGAGIYAYKQHEKKVEEQSQRQDVEKVTYQSYQESNQAPAVPPQEKHWYEDHKKELIGAGAIAAVGAGVYAHKHHEKNVEEESYHTPAVPPQEKHWYDEHKKELIGAGAIAAVGAGIYAYKQHEKSVEEQQAKAWSASHWVQDAQLRTQQWRAGQSNAPVAWIWNEGKSIPHDAIQGGEERGEVLYICRVYHESGLLIGKASRVFKKGAVIGFKKEEIHIDKYEILVGDARAVRWVPCSGRLKLEYLGARPVEGGKEPDGTPIYIAQAPHHGAVHPGKACEIYGDGCFIPYDDSEKKVKEYAVLCYA